MRPVRARAACLLRCYEGGLARDPTLHGRVLIKFIVDSDGWVRTASAMPSDLPDAQVRECLAREFVGLRYPEPEGGPVLVVYPLAFSAPEGGTE
jgi:hypothetical protein